MSLSTAILINGVLDLGIVLAGERQRDHERRAAAGRRLATTAPRQPPPAFRNMPAPGTAAHEDNEKAVTGDAATKAQAAAVKAAGGGTAGDVTTDYFGSGYEVTVTKSNGSKVEIHLDSSFNVRLGPPGGRFGGPPPAAPSATFD